VRARPLAYSNLHRIRLVESQIETVIRQRTNLRRLTVVADANDWNVCRFDERNQFGHLCARVCARPLATYAPSVLIAAHAVHFVHDEHVVHATGVTVNSGWKCSCA
jgi:hypothetical protein